MAAKVEAAKPAHSKFSPSKAKIWMRCKGAIKLCSTLVSSTSAAASEGTMGHALLEMCITNRELPDTFIGEEIEYEDHGETKEGKVTEDMALAVRYAYDLLLAEEANTPGGVLYTEKRLNIFEDVDGTVDNLIVNPFGNKLKVYDYKHGRGVYVSATENEQMMFYAFGALKELKQEGITEVEMIIIQPRGSWANKHNSWSCSVVELEAFMAKAVKAKHAAEKLKRVTEASLHDGDWCKSGFCEARKQKVCPLLRKRTKEGLQIVGAGALVTIPDASKLGVAELSRVKNVATAVTDFFKACDKKALELAEAGQVVPGWSLTEDYANRDWVNVKKAQKAFDTLGDDVLFKTERKFITPAQIEKIKGVDKETVKALVGRKLKGFKLKKA